MDHANCRLICGLLKTVPKQIHVENMGFGLGLGTSLKVTVYCKDAQVLIYRGGKEKTFI